MRSLVLLSRFMEPFFLTAEEVRDLASRFGTPTYVYDEATIRARTEEALAMPHAFGLTVRYAMKALPNRQILRRLHEWGVAFDASSGFEVERLRRAGIPFSAISLSTQELPENIGDYLKEGILLNACSLHQIERAGRAGTGREIGLRVNPGVGSGSTAKTNTGGPSSSFGIWHEFLDQARSLAQSHGLRITRMHSHIGSGTDAEIWDRAASLTIATVRAFPDVTTIDLGGGFRVESKGGAQPFSLSSVGERFAQALRRFRDETGRELHLEIEPGKFLVANAGVLLTRVQDTAETGAEGFRFLKLDAGMTEILRPSLYAAQHPLRVVPLEDREGDEEDVIVVGHCCESGDLITCDPEDAYKLKARLLPRAEPGDLLQIGMAGAYCSAMSAINYNSFPQAPEILRESKGAFTIIRERQSLEQMLANER